MNEKAPPKSCLNKGLMRKTTFGVHQHQGWFLFYLCQIQVCRLCELRISLYLLENLCNSANKAMTNIISAIKSVTATQKAENIQPMTNDTIGIMIENTR